MMKIFRKRLSNRKGFTLIELIVVIAILGILAAIAVPRLGGFRDDATTSAQDANERIVQSAASLWLAENGNPSSEVTWNGTAGQDWEDYIDVWPANIATVTIGTDGTISVTGN